MVSGAVSGRPDIGQSHSRMKTVKDREWEGDVAEHSPQGGSIKFLPGLQVGPLRFRLHGLPDVHGNVGHDQECDQVLAGLPPLVL